MVRYSHYSLMIYGFNRIPIVGWFRSQSAESLARTEQMAKRLLHSVVIPRLKWEVCWNPEHAVGEILNESLEHERIR